MNLELPYQLEWRHEWPNTHYMLVNGMAICAFEEPVEWRMYGERRRLKRVESMKRKLEKQMLGL